MEPKYSVTSRGEDAVVGVNGSWRWLRLTIGMIWRTSERVVQLFVHLATHSGQVPHSRQCLSDVHYNWLVPTWFGRSCDVYEGTWSTPQTNVTVVVKRLRMKMKGHEDRLMPWGMYIEGLRRGQFDHPNIVKVLGVLREECDGRERLALVSVRMEGDLRSFLRSESYNSHIDRKRLLIEITSALVHLHDQGIVHGNVSLRKILVQRGHAFLNAASFAIGDENTRCLGVLHCGSIQYKAPELLFPFAEDAQDNEWFGDEETRMPEGLPAKTVEDDVFAYGRLVFAIVIKDNPFGAVNDAVVVGKIRLGHPRKRPPASMCHGAPMSDSLWELTRACWQTEPGKRPTMRDIHRSLSSPGFDA